MSLTLPLALLLGCPASDPERNEAARYITEVQPLMLENRLLAERRLQLAAEIYNGRMEGDALVKRWDEEVVPLSRHLHMQAELVEAPDAWKELHTTLVTTWTDRSRAYTDMGEALALSDKKRWEDARALHGSVLKREEQWFDSVRNRLAPYELELQQYP
ncbi:MAG: hypothetical protein H6734_19765 [Alphaproteobacteria bacterium]|nr:hypothetical protein [Alphaproteobacteria bacterium]